MRMTYQTILDVWDDPETNGIFTELQKLEVPWKSLNVAQVLDVDYYYNHSGQKIISPLVRSQLSDSKITSTSSEKLANIIYTICNDNWKKVYNALTVDYSPIENVDAHITETTDTTKNNSGSTSMKDTGTDTNTKSGSDTTTNSGTDRHTLSGTDSTTKSGSDTHTESGSDTLSMTGTDEHAYTGTENIQNTGTQENANVTNSTVEVDNQIYGYNSTTAVDDGKSTTTTQSTSTDTRTDNLLQLNTHDTKDTETLNRTDTTQYGKVDSEDISITDSTTYGKGDLETVDISNTTNYNSSNEETLNISHAGTSQEDETGKIEHELYRHGNIGVTTNQQMITEEIALRKNFFFEIVFADIDKYLTLKIY